ncbi:hypothetical protein [Enterocloster sp.]|uniref:hypothetical protein n=1 Tax=Enterocloster sp. TaxID=2719315 RepID=UPI0039A15C00
MAATLLWEVPTITDTGFLSAHGIQVESVKQRTAGNAASLLDSGHILIALMGKGALTDNGHFILITEYLDNGMSISQTPTVMRTAQKNGNWACFYGGAETKP